MCFKVSKLAAGLDTSYTCGTTTAHTHTQLGSSLTIGEPHAVEQIKVNQLPILPMLRRFQQWKRAYFSRCGSGSRRQAPTYLA